MFIQIINVSPFNYQIFEGSLEFSPNRLTGGLNMNEIRLKI